MIVKKGHVCMLIDVSVPGDRNVIKKEAEKILKYKDLTTEIQRKCNVKTKAITSNNIGSWNHLKIIQKIPHQQTGKARNQGTTVNSHLGHCHTAESADWKAQNIYNDT
jgi:hypothetical protein